MLCFVYHGSFDAGGVSSRSALDVLGNSAQMTVISNTVNVYCSHAVDDDVG